MKSIYVRNRPLKDLAKIKAKHGADRIYEDSDATGEAQLQSMIDIIKATEGECVVLVYAFSDLGTGRRQGRIVGLIESAGATIELIDTPKPPERRGRPASSVYTVEKFDAVCPDWFGPVSEQGVVEKHGMTRDQLNYLCGPRHGRLREQKREILVKREMGRD